LDRKNENKEKFDIYIFYSKQYNVKLDKNQLALYNSYEYTELIPVNILNDMIPQEVKLKLRDGDVVWFQKDEKERYERDEEERYRNDDVVIWDSYTKSIVHLDFSYDDYGMCPKLFDITTFPIMSYFYSTIAHNSYVWCDTNVPLKSDNPQFLSKSKYYTRVDGIMIFSELEDFTEVYSKNKILSCSYSDNNPLFEENLRKNIKNPRILFLDDDYYSEDKDKKSETRISNLNLIYLYYLLILQYN
jgi:hypothetical protein